MTVRDRWGGGRSGRGARWEVRWRAGGVQRKRRFRSRLKADAFDAEVRMDPEEAAAEVRQTVTVQQLVDGWLATTAGLRPATRDGYRYDARRVSAAFGDRLAASVKPGEVRLWLAEVAGDWQRRKAFMALRRAYKLGMADGLVKVDPTAGIPLPRVRQTEMRFLSWSELEALAGMAGTDGPLVWLLGTAGLRLGEALGLDVADVDRVRRRIRVARSYSVSSQGLELGPTKNRRVREVPVSPFVLDMLREGRGPLFPAAGGGRINPANWRLRVFRRAARAAGLGDLHPHELRHTAASLAIAAGADVKTVQRMLGHASAAITLDLYTHLWDAQMDQVADRMDEARRAAKPPRHLRAIGDED